MDRSETDQQATTPAARFRRFSVVDKRHENGIICSFLLKPEDPNDWCTFQAGQFLSLKIRRAEGRPILRNYSVSSDPAIMGTYRITVKRESAPRPGVPDGLGSAYLHDEVQIGSSLEIAGPRGHFYLDETSNRPLVLLSGGVGLTPMVSMLHVAMVRPRLWRTKFRRWLQRIRILNATRFIKARQKKIDWPRGFNPRGLLIARACKPCCLPLIMRAICAGRHPSCRLFMTRCAASIFRTKISPMNFLVPLPFWTKNQPRQNFDYLLNQ